MEFYKTALERRVDALVESRERHVSACKGIKRCHRGIIAPSWGHVALYSQGVSMWLGGQVQWVTISFFVMFEGSSPNCQHMFL